jgi:hypothetical protein
MLSGLIDCGVYCIEAAEPYSTDYDVRAACISANKSWAPAQ